MELLNFIKFLKGDIFMVNFGTDINRLWIPNAQGDFAIVTGLDNAAQAVYNRVMTKLGELDCLGYTNYGNQSDECLGMTDLQTAEQLIILYTNNCLLQEPRVQDIQNITCVYDGKVATVDALITLIGEDTPNNLVFTLGA